MRAVSSPSLTENPIENIIKNKPTTTTTANTINDNCNDMTNRVINNQQQHHQRPVKIPLNGTNTNIIVVDKQQQAASSGSVLQKLKNTFSHLKGKSAAVTITSDCDAQQQQQQTSTNASSSSLSYRLGPLVWRSSKERKNKQYRNDKCNSGDSGIQCELDLGTTTSSSTTIGQQQITRTSLSSRNSRDTSPPLNLPVRRANSAKEQSSSLSSPPPAATTSSMTKSLSRIQYQQQQQQQQKTAIELSMPLSKRSYSQPSSLDRIPPPLPPPDCESDSDSLTNEYQPVYAEVLYTFKPLGPQELALEKGELVEVIKRDSGPWWWGHIKHEAILSSSATQLHEGWFPKEFVRILSATSFSTKPSSDRQQQHHSPVPPPLPSASSYQLEVESAYQPKDVVTTPTASSDINNSLMIGQNSQQQQQQRNSSAPKPRRLFKQRPVSCEFPCSDAIRNNIIKELLDTEINYVKLLTSLCEG